MKRGIIRQCNKKRDAFYNLLMRGIVASFPWSLKTLKTTTEHKREQREGLMNLLHNYNFLCVIINK